MYKRFTGKLALEDQSRFDATVTISDEVLSISADGSPIGDWPLKYCRVSTSDDAVFALWVDGERATFRPDEPRSFGLAAAQQLQASSLAERIGVMRSVIEPLPPVEEEPSPTEDDAPSVPTDTQSLFSPRRAQIGLAVSVVAILGLVAVATFDDWSFGGSSGPATTTTAPTTTTSSVPEPEKPAVFTSTPEDFQQMWNRTAVDLDSPQLTLGGLGTMSFEASLSEMVVIAGLVDEEGILNSLTLTIDPSGDPESDGFAIGALGVTMAVVDPSLDGPQRRALLARLGLDLADPQLEGVDGEETLNGVVYDLRFISVVGDAGRLLFIAEPA